MAHRYQSGHVAVLLALATLGAASGWATARAEAPKNVILIVGDGMGYEQTRLSRYYFNGTNSLYNFEQFSNFAIMTHDAAGGAVTDSAASATAMATGVKVNNGNISTAADNGTPLTTLLEQFKTAGKSTGLVTTAYMTDATPAAFGAHATHRSQDGNIAEDYFVRSQPNVLFGGASTGLTPGFTVGAANTAGYTVVTNKASMQAINTNTATQVAGVFGTGGTLPYNFDNTAYSGVSALPRLSEMATTALNILDNNASGFFLLLENELTDDAGHGNSRTNSVHEVRQVAQTVDSVLAWANNRPQGLSDTLVVVLADHETGGISFSDYPGTGTLPTVAFSTTGHSKTPVGVYAMGANSELFTGKIDNTQISALATASNDNAHTKYFRQGLGPTPVTMDTTIRQMSPSDATLGTAATLKVDADDGGGVTRALIKFAELFGNGPGQIPLNATITSAYLTVHTGATTNDVSLQEFSIQRMKIDWNESSTWNTLVNGVSGSGEVETTPDDSGQMPDILSEMVAFGVTASLQSWLADAKLGIDKNFGWMLGGLAIDGWVLFSSEATDITQRPMLSVSFTVPEAAAVPEPAALSILGLGIPILLRARRRRGA